MSKIKIAIAGVGNCASTLVQGHFFYKNRPQYIYGLDYQVLGGYTLDDFDFVCAFDVTQEKVGKNISEAIFAYPNCTKDLDGRELPMCSGEVYPVPMMDGVASHMKEVLHLYEGPTVDVREILKIYSPDVLVSYLPVGSAEASRFYAQACLDTGVSFINAIPEFICSSKEWGDKFAAAGIPCAGDDIKSQVGATILHRVLAKLIDDRGLKIDTTYQLNIGGNTDFQNMIDESRLVSKRKSKTQAVMSILSERNNKIGVKIGPSDFVSHLGDNKVCYINIKGKQFGDIPFDLECKLSVEDSPNSAGVIVDAIRAIKLARDAGIGGPLIEASSYFFKSPPVQIRDDVAHSKLDSWIEETSLKVKK